MPIHFDLLIYYDLGCNVKGKVLIYLNQDVTSLSISPFQPNDYFPKLRPEGMKYSERACYQTFLLNVHQYKKGKRVYTLRYWNCEEKKTQ